MEFIDYYLKNKDKFPELEFYEVKYSGNNVGYNLSYNKMKYLERDMIIMIPSACSQIFKKNLKSINKLIIYMYFRGSFYSEINESEIKRYESLFLTSDNKILLTLKRFSPNVYDTIDLKEYKETETLLTMINSFLNTSGLDSKYFSIQLSEPIYSSVWGIQYRNFTSIKEYDLKLIDYTLLESIKINFKKINFKK